MTGKQVIMNIDNTVVYYSVNAGKSKDPKLMKLIRSIEDNAIADSLSRLDIPRFRLLYPQGDYLMTQLKEELILEF